MAVTSIKVRRLNPDVVVRLKLRTRSNHRSVEAEVRWLVTQAVFGNAVAAPNHSIQSETSTASEPTSSEPIPPAPQESEQHPPTPTSILEPEELDQWSPPVPNAAEVEKFKKLYAEQYGIELSTEDAFDAFSRILTLLPFIRHRPSAQAQKAGTQRSDKTGLAS